jgi:hypothetical protein
MHEKKMHENKKVAKRTTGGHFRQAATSIKHEKIPPSPHGSI